MALTNNFPKNEQAVLDANYIVVIAGPAAGATANTNALDLGPYMNLANGSFVTTGTPYPLTRYVEAQLRSTASACTANTKNTNIVIQHAGSNTDGTVNAANWANIPELAAPLLRVTDSSGNTAAGAANVILPRSTRRFIRAQAALEANGGTVADMNVTLQLAF